ncbi:MAG: pilus assembly protein PilM [Candidatus Omnitrophica bacterium]|nr:pilus assembly protein PilM [Candidatus Omnitrophota bacterium]
MIKSIGLDIAGDSIRIVECTQDKKDITISRVGALKLVQKVGVSGDDILHSGINTLLKELSIKNRRVNFAMPGSSAFVRTSKILVSERRRLEEMVRHEAIQTIPFNLEEVAWDYFLTKDFNDAVKGSRIPQEVELVLVAVKKDLIEQKRRLIETAGVSVSRVSTRPLAAYTCLQFSGKRAADTHRLFVEVGLNYTDIVLGRGKDVWVRSLPFGLPEDLSSVQDAKLRSWIGEVKRACEFYFMERFPEQSSGIAQVLKEHIQYVDLAGPAGASPEISALFKEVFGKEAALFNPFAVAPLSKEAESVVARKALPELSTFAACLGLALSRLGPDESAINLYKDSLSSRRQSFEKRLYTTLAYCCGFAIVASAAFPLGGDIQVKRELLADLEGMLSEARSYRPKIIRLTEQRNLTKEKVNTLYSIAINRGIWLDILNGLKESLPGDVWITELDGTKEASGQLVAELTIKGNGPSYEQINKLVSALKLSRYFEDVKPVSSSVVRVDDAEVVEFTITMGVKGKQFWDKQG